MEKVEPIILHGTSDKRYVVVVHQDKIQKYGFFDDPDDALQWWQDHKTPFFESDRPKGWAFGTVATYDKLEQTVTDWNCLYLNEEIVMNCITQMLDDFNLIGHKPKIEPFNNTDQSKTDKI